jgi:hypothetical protein
LRRDATALGLILLSMFMYPKHTVENYSTTKFR